MKTHSKFEIKMSRPRLPMFLQAHRIPTKKISIECVGGAQSKLSLSTPSGEAVSSWTVKTWPTAPDLPQPAAGWKNTLNQHSNSQPAFELQLHTTTQVVIVASMLGVWGQNDFPAFEILNTRSAWIICITSYRRAWKKGSIWVASWVGNCHCNLNVYDLLSFRDTFAPNTTVEALITIIYLAFQALKPLYHDQTFAQMGRALEFRQCCQL